MTKKVKTGERIAIIRPATDPRTGVTESARRQGSVMAVLSRQFQVQTDCGRRYYVGYDDEYERLS